jgi:hypothetical protein
VDLLVQKPLPGHAPLHLVVVGAQHRRGLRVLPRVYRARHRENELLHRDRAGVELARRRALVRALADAGPRCPRERFPDATLERLAVGADVKVILTWAC